MKKAVLHIGYPKTATSWFQKSYFPRVKNVDFYSHLKLPTEFFKEKTNNNILKVREYFERSKNTIVISDETLLGKFSAIENNAIKYKAFFEDAVVIIFLRNQLEKFASNYSHYIKFGGTGNLNEFLYPDRSNNLYGGEKHKYHYILEVYKSVFGEKNVHVYLFEDFQKNPLEFTEQFSANNNFEISSNELSFKKVNRILSPSLLKFKRYCNFLTKYQMNMGHPSCRNKKYLLHIPLWYQFSSLLFEKMNSLSFIKKETDHKEFLGEKNLNILTQYFSETNRKLIRDHNLEQIQLYNYPL
ncbi:MAG: hypothetical protein JXJ22_06640 [Bacteroidales bacterium]|nr:hypothetical protein [Bacteroidales bacterium]